MLTTEADPRSDHLVVVSNRLPVSRVRRGRHTDWEASPGGLVSALRPILRGRSCKWIGWPGVSDIVMPFDFDGISNIPVTLSADEIKGFYEGFANRALWPLFHDVVRPPEYHRPWWKAYVEVNHRFAEVAAETAPPHSVIWVHDYHLHLVPEFLRRMRPDARIGFFLHIPFPPQELFAQLPWRTELLRGMLGADVVGFQTQVGARNFAQVCRRFAGAEGNDRQLIFDDRTIHVGAFPISIDFKHYHDMAATAEVAMRREELRERIGRSRRLILGIDRLDYTKGIDIRLQAFRELLASGRVARDQCVLVQVAVPSRELVSEYRDLRRRVERMVGEINGEFGDIGNTPVQYLHRGVSQVELAALYSAADVMVVTPLRDGMNLVSKEYIASRIDEDGVLVLSEFAGAAKELEQALLVNPHDIDGVVRALDAALNMPRDEQITRMRTMRSTVRAHDVYAWAADFFNCLERAHVG